MHNRKRLYIALPVIGVLLVGAAALLAFFCDECCSRAIARLPKILVSPGMS